MGSEGPEGFALAPSLEAAKHVKSENGEMLTKPFLDVCRLLFPVIGTIFGSNLIVPFLN